MCVCGLLFLTLCDNKDSSQSGSSVRGISQQEFWSGLPFPTLGDLPGPGRKPTCPVSPASADIFFTTESPGKPNILTGTLNRPGGWQSDEKMKVLLTLHGADSGTGHVTDKSQRTPEEAAA